jgi:hypothetical protein
MTDRERTEGTRGEDLNITPQHGTPERGRAGGYAAAMPAAPVFTIERVRWGAVWAGVLVAITVFILLSGLGAGAGLYSFSSAGYVAPGFWAAIWLFAALFIGGWVASRLSGVTETNGGIWHGTLVWALSFALLTAFSLIGGAVVSLAALSARATTMQTGISITGWTLFAGIIIAWFFAIAGGILGKRSTPENQSQPR